MKLLTFFLIYSAVQAISVGWLFQRPIPVWMRLAILVPILALFPAVLWVFTRQPFTIDPFAILWVYIAIGGAITGFVGGLIWYFAGLASQQR